jgi:hypothetical protein
LILVLAAALLCGCHTVNLTSFNTGETIQLHSRLLSRNVWARMPDGERLEGKIASVSNESSASATGGSAAFGLGGISATADGSSRHNSGDSGVIYALLKSTRRGSKLVLEITGKYNPVSKQGFGQARTNDGRTYQVVF